MQSQHTRLHWEVNALAEVAAESESQRADKLATCAEIEVLARKLWGETVSVAHHGSTHSGASLRGSDLDVVLAGVQDLPKPDNPGGNGYLPQTREKVADCLEDLKQILSDETNLVSGIEIVRTARMPLLKAKIAGGVDLKATLSPLGVNEIPACQTAELVSKTFKELPHARKLLLILKALMRSPNCLSTFVGVHTGGVSSYTVTLMVLAFCKFQATQLNVSNVDLGSLFLSFLQFYSESTHFDVTRHAIDVVVPSGFAQKHEVQANLDPSVKLAMADKLCALEPISRHDIGQNSYRIKQVLEVMGGLRTHLASMNPYLSAGESDIEALRIMSSPRSYRTAVTPRQPEGSNQDATFTSAWVERYLPLLGTILDIASIIPIKPESPSASGPPKVPPPQHEFPPGSIFVPGYGAMTLGQVSMLSAQEAPLMGPHGHFGPDAFPTLQESASAETSSSKSPTQQGQSARRGRGSPNGRGHNQMPVQGMHGVHMHGGFPGQAMYGVYAPHLVSEHSFPGAGKKGGHHGGPGQGPLSRGHSTPNQHGGGNRRGGAGGPQKSYHNRNHSFGSSSHTSHGPPHNADRAKPSDTKSQPGGRNPSPKRRSKTSPRNAGRQAAGMNRNGSAAQLRESESSSWRERDNMSGATRDRAADSKSEAAPSCTDRTSVPPGELRTEGAPPADAHAAPAADKTFEKPMGDTFSEAGMESSSGGGQGAGSSSTSTVALSMRSKSAGTASSSAVSPMTLSLSPHVAPSVGADAAIPSVQPVAASARAEARLSDTGSSEAAPNEEAKDKDSAPSESASTPSAMTAASKMNSGAQHKNGEGRGDGTRGFAPGVDKRFNNGNAPWGGRSGGRRYKDRAGRDGSSGRSYNPGGGTGAFQGHQHAFGSGGRGAARWGGRNPHNSWNGYNGSSQNTTQRGHMAPPGGPGGMHMVPVQLPVYPAYPNNSPYVAPYYFMHSPQNGPAQAASATTSETSAQQSSSQSSAPATAAAANGTQSQQKAAAPADESAKLQQAAGAAVAAATPPSQPQHSSGGKRQSGEAQQAAAQQSPAQSQAQGMPAMTPMMIVPNNSPPGQGGSAGGAPQHGPSHSWPNPVLHHAAMMPQHPGGPSFMPQAVMYVALPTHHMQMPPGSQHMPQFRHHGRGNGGAPGGVPNRDQQVMPRNNGGKHRNGPGQGFDAHNGNGRGRGDGQGGRGSWNASGGRGGAGRGGGTMHKRNGSFGHSNRQHMGGRWRGEQSQGLHAPEVTQE